MQRITRYLPLLAILFLFTAPVSAATVTVTFNGLVDGDTPGAGNWDSYFLGLCIESVTGVGNSGFGPMIFDTLESHTDDDDLEIGGATFGNLLILSENGSTTDPDDDASGGYIDFVFTEGVEITRMWVVDIEGSETATLSFF